jgi:serine/threonine-protein kinase
MLVQHIQAQPVPPSQRTEQPVPPELERIIMWCLEKDPARRPSNADELIAALNQVELDPEWDQLRAREWWESHMAEPPGERPDQARRMLAVG